MSKQPIFAPPGDRLVLANRPKTDVGKTMDWRMRAACLHADLELFFPECTTGPMIDRAKQICGCCPVRTRCLDWALGNGVGFGIWGGRTEAERHGMRMTDDKETPQ